jgi:hypothetical protein
MKACFAVIVLTIALLAGTVFAQSKSSSQSGAPAYSGFEITETAKNYDGKDIVIAKGWRFVGVSNGEKVNSNNLWFQDRDGAIYMLQGYTDGGTFVFRNVVTVIKAK